MKKLLLGDEAIAQAAIDAGLSGVYAYPGTPSTEITEYIQNSQVAKELAKVTILCASLASCIIGVIFLLISGKVQK